MLFLACAANAVAIYECYKINLETIQNGAGIKTIKNNSLWFR